MLCDWDANCVYRRRLSAHWTEVGVKVCSHRMRCVAAPGSAARRRNATHSVERTFSYMFVWSMRLHFTLLLRSTTMDDIALPANYLVRLKQLHKLQFLPLNRTHKR